MSGDQQSLVVSSLAAAQNDHPPEINEVIASRDKGQSRSQKPIVPNELIPVPAPELVVRKKPRKNLKPAVVLEEDDYLDTMTHIIQRDFFPALPNLQAALGQRPVAATPAFTPSSASSSSIPSRQHRTPKPESADWEDDDDEEEAQTPAPSSSSSYVSTSSSSAPRTNSKSKRRRDPEGDEVQEQEQAENKGSERENDSSQSMPPPPPRLMPRKDLSLGKFVALHTSEDNAAFNELLDRANERRRYKYAWAADQEKRHNINMLMDPHRTGMLDTWSYTGQNALMYTPDTNEVKQVSEEVSRGPEKQIVYENTRFPGPLFQDSPQLAQQASATEAAIVHGGTPSVNGFKFMRTPSPAVGSGGESPLMTWGDVMGTPLHLSQEDTVKSKVPSFSVPATPSRDMLAWRLAEKNKARQRKQQKQQQAAKLSALSSPSPYRGGGGGSTPLVALSPAAQRLAAGALASSRRTDAQLRASYSPSPSIVGGHRSAAKAFQNTPTPIPIPSPSPLFASASTPLSQRPSSSGSSSSATKQR